MARLNHPNIVGIHDFGINEDGQYYLVMEYVDGVGLDHLIANGPVSPKEALAIVPQICDALQFAHDHGVVHRDIKPGNILLSHRGQVKVTDFGLAKMVSEKNADMSITATGYVMGTPDYMAPEQFEGGEAVDHRVDIYALGTVFYQLLTGQLPRGAYDPPSKRIRIDVRADEVVVKALESEPERRYQRVSELKEDVEEISVERRRSHQPGKRILKLAVVLAVMVLLLAAGGVWLESRTSRSAESLPGDTGQKTGADADIGISRAFPPVDMSVFPLPFPTRPSEQGRFAAFRRANLVTGQVGMPRSLTAAVPPPEIASREDLVALSASVHWKPRSEGGQTHHLLALTAEGEVLAWGGNDFGECEVPEGLSDVVDIEAGTLNSLALTSDGHLHVWGRDKDRMSEVPPEIQGQIVAMDEGDSHVLALTQDGKVWAWGRPEPGMAEVPDGLDGVVAIAAGNRFNLAIRSEGSIVTWGSDSHGQLGNEIDFPPLSYAEAFGGNGFALDREGSFHTWGIGLMALTNPAERVLWPEDGVRFDRLESGSAGGYALRDQSNRRWRVYGMRYFEIPEPFQLALDLEVSRSHVFAIIDPDSDYIPAEDQPKTNSLGMKLYAVSVDGGLEEGTVVYMSEWETRVSDYRSFVEDSTGIEWPDAGFEQEPDHPAVMLSWRDAVAFCEWLTAKEQEEGLLEEGWRYRLPSDLEWSWAVGIGHFEDPAKSPSSRSDLRPDTPWGNAREVFGVANLMGAEVLGDPRFEGKSPIPSFRDEHVFTGPVGSYPPNLYGLHDLAGNVREWCEDAFHPGNPYARAVRGSAWNSSDEKDLRASHREGLDEMSRFPDVGFRIVLDPGS